MKRFVTATLLLVLSFSLFANCEQLSDEQYNQAKSSFIAAIKQDLDENPALSILDFKAFILGEAEVLYANGDLNLATMNMLLKWDTIREVQEGESSDTASTRCDQLDYKSSNDYSAIQKKLISMHRFLDCSFQLSINNKPTCAQHLENATTRKCAGSLVRSYDPSYVERNPSAVSKKKSGEGCEAHEQCASQLCEGLAQDETGKGVCSEVVSCFQTSNLNESCSQTQPCAEDEGVCMSRNFCSAGTGGLALGATCNSDSNRIEIDWMAGGSLIAGASDNNTTNSSSSQCCSGKCEGGVCVENFKCTQCTSLNNTIEEGKRCCPGLVEFEGRCLLGMPRFYKKTSFIKTILNFIIPVAYAQDSNLAQLQLRTFEMQLKSCLEDDSSTSAVCLIQFNSSLSNLEQSSNSERPPLPRDLDIPEIKGNGVSDINNCTFNSWADNWQRFAKFEKDAELALRGFEIIYSGDGTKDYQSLEGETAGINSALSKIAIKLRQSRSKIMLMANEVDNSMFCKCGEILGTEKFDEARKNLYQSFCQSEAQSDDSSQQSIEDTDNERVTTQEEINEIDEGATALKAQALFLEYLYEQAQFQLEMFNETDSLSEELEKLIGKIESTHFDQYQLTQPIPLYSFGTQDSNWLMATLSTIASPFVAIGRMFMGERFSMHKAMDLMFHRFKKGSFDKLVTNEALIFIDDQKESTAHIRGRRRKYNRSVAYPYYPCSDSQSGRVGDMPAIKGVAGTRSLCAKNTYIPTIDSALSDNLEYKKWFANISELTLVDLYFPDFYPVENSDFFIEDMKIIEGYNLGFNSGLHFLRQGKTGDYPWISPRGRRNYFARNFKDEKLLLKHADKFAPILPEGMKKSDGSLNPRYVFDQAKIDKLKEAIRVYASCNTYLKDCANNGATYNGSTKFGLKNDVTVKFSSMSFQKKETESKDPVGLGYMFADNQEIEDFTSLVYQHHFFFPRLSADSGFYPLTGMQAYLDHILYSSIVMGAYQLGRAEGYADLYTSYYDDFQNKINSYDLSIGNANFGASSKNVLVQMRAISSAGKIEFATGAGLETFNAAMSDVKKASEATSFGSFDPEKINRFAMRATAYNNKAKAIDKELNRTPILSAMTQQKKDFLKSASMPLRNGALGLNSRVGSANSDNTNASTSNPNNQIPSRASLPSSNYDSFDAADSYSSPSFSSSYSSGSSSRKSQSGMNQNQVQKIIDSVEKNKQALMPSDNDSLFGIVSKGYKRNLYRVLERRESSVEAQQSSKAKKKTLLDSKTKDKLEKLLE